MGANTISPVKLIGVSRWKPDMTRDEFFDHYYNRHGSLACQPSNPEEEPHKYIQNHVFDGAFPQPLTGGPNSNHRWVGRDGMAEIVFRNTDHLVACLQSDHFRLRIRPDEANFADGATTIFLIARERPLKLPPHMTYPDSQRNGRADQLDTSFHETTAQYFIATHEWREEKEWIESLEEELSGLLRTALEQYAASSVYRVVINTRVSTKEFDFAQRFALAKKETPEFSFMCKIYFCPENGGIAAIRKSQKAFEEMTEGKIDKSLSFLLFGKEVKVLDMEEGIEYIRKRQPMF